MVNKQCLDGKYTETLPNKDAPISQIISAYKPAAYKQFIKDVLAARYPFGKTLVEGALKSAPQDCVDTFLPASMRGSASQVMSRLGTIVHECGHFYDIYGAGGLTSKQWVIKDGLTFKCKGARATDSKRSSFGSNPSFSRNKINKDKWSAKHPPCTSFGGGSKNCDSYAYIYLNGDPDNGKFESGDQGFDNLIEEVTQYVNSLATGYAYQDQKGGFSKSSDRDGILNFLWYTERYLHMARTKYPDFYKFAANDKCWRELVLTLWGRAWLYLEATKNNSNLGINDAKLMGLVKDPELLAEIELFRKAQGCK